MKRQPRDPYRDNLVNRRSDPAQPPVKHLTLTSIKYYIRWLIINFCVAGTIFVKPNDIQSYLLIECFWSIMKLFNDHLNQVKEFFTSNKTFVCKCFSIDSMKWSLYINDIMRVFHVHSVHIDVFCFSSWKELFPSHLISSFIILHHLVTNIIYKICNLDLLALIPLLIFNHIGDLYSSCRWWGLWAYSQIFIYTSSVYVVFPIGPSMSYVRGY